MVFSVWVPLGAGYPFRRKENWLQQSEEAQGIVDTTSLPYINAHIPKGDKSIMGLLKSAMISVGLAQAGPKITAHDRAILEYVHLCSHPLLTLNTEMGG